MSGVLEHIFEGGFTLHSREDFDIAPTSKKWWED
jgi:hypothetical protein